MSPLVLKIFVALFAVTMCASMGHPSGSWVGNSPVQVASNVSAIYKPTYASSAPEESGKVWNSLLLPDGESRLSFSVAYKTWQQSEIAPVEGSFLIGWDHAFTEKLTTFSLLNWGYSLRAGNGIGHEWALIGGLGAAQFSSLIGAYSTPEVGVAYSYSEPGWRFTIKPKITGYYLLDSSSFDWYSFRTEFNYMMWVGERLGFGIGTAYSIERSSFVARHLNRYSGFLEAPTLSAAIKLTENFEIRGSYRFENQQHEGMQEFGIGLAYTW